MSDLDYFFANKAPSTVCRGNLRMEFHSENASNVFCSHNNHRCQESLCAPSRVSFQKFFNCFFYPHEDKAGNFKVLRFEERFTKSSVFGPV